MSEPTGEVISLPIADIGVDQGVRHDRLDLDHIARLRDVLDDLPPILVRKVGERWELIDGSHRVAAHGREDRTHVSAVVIEASDVEALLTATEANISHGRPLDTTDRKRAAERIMALDPERSNREIAKRCGLSPSTVAELRPRPTVQSGQLDAPKRTGGDGKARPATKADAERARERAAEIVAEEPDIGTRDLSKRAGVSRGTAADVKKRGHLRDVSATAEEKAQPTIGDMVTVLPDSWARHPAAKRSNEGRDFCNWMQARSLRSVKSDDEAAVAAANAERCPADLLDAAIAQAHINAAAWTRFAEVAASRKHRMEAVK